jgi:hypothetical protein
MTNTRAWIAVAVLGLPFVGSALAQTTSPQTPVPTSDQAAHGAVPASTDATKAVRTPAPKDAYVYIGWPNDGEVIRSARFHVWFGTRNFGVSPAGFSKPNTGHHHLLIDAPLPPMDEPIPNDKNHLHFGAGQTETILELPPGKHTLQLLMGDGNHVPHAPPVMSRKITITVKQ